MRPPLVLASASRYRAQILRDAGIDASVRASQVDERQFDPVFYSAGPVEYVLGLARAKAESVAAQLRIESPNPDVWVLGCDQIAVLETSGGPMLLHKPGTAERAITQLMAMSGTAHRLINALVLLEATGGTGVQALDEHLITMEPFDLTQAARYVEEYLPLDCAGSYRIEDDAGLIASVQGEHRSGIIGLPVPTLERLLTEMENRR